MKNFWLHDRFKVGDTVFLGSQEMTIKKVIFHHDFLVLYDCDYKFRGSVYSFSMVFGHHQLRRTYGG